MTGCIHGNITKFWDEAISSLIIPTHLKFKFFRQYTYPPPPFFNHYPGLKISKFTGNE